MRSHSAPPWRRSSKGLALIACLALIAAACGSDDGTDGAEDAPPADTGDASEAPEPDGEAGGEVDLEDAYEEVYAAVEGLEGEERVEALLELANEEPGAVIYTANTGMEELVGDYEDFYGDRLSARPSVYRAPSDTVLARLLEEASAGFQGADLVELHAAQLQALNQEGVLREHSGPVIDARDADLNFDTWYVTRMTAYAPAWNTDLVAAGEEPTSYEEFADPRWADDIYIEPREFEWFMTLWEHFEDEGWSEEEIEEYFRALVDNAVQQRGHNEQTQFLSAGQVAASVGLFVHLAAGAMEEGAPVENRPFVEPVIIIPSGAGLVTNARSPAGAILFTEYLLTEAQERLREQVRVPPIEFEAGGMLEGVEFLVVDPERLIGDEATEWQERYDALLQGQ